MEIKPFTSEFDDYLRDESRRCGSATHIVFAKDEADVQGALAAAREKVWNVTIQGARTGVSAGAVPEGGLILNLSRMKKIGAVQNSGCITVQPGALLREIQTVAGVQNLFFPPDPTETSASIGGMLANNASGALSFHYGPTRNWVNALRVVLADGDIVRLERGQKADGRRFSLVTEGGRTINGELPNLKMPPVKNAAGYFIKPDMELIDLFIGMEGTLGVITEVELKLIAVPPVQQALCAFFPDEQSALRFVRFLRGKDRSTVSCPPVAIEFFDVRVLTLLRRAKAENPAFAELPELPAHFNTAIYFEFHSGSEDAVELAVMSAAEQIEALGIGENDCWFASNAKEIEIMKKFRHATPEAVNLLIDERRKKYPGLTKLGTDMSVPDSAMEEIMSIYHAGLSAAGLEYVIFGHIGNSHVHVNILPRNMDDYENGKALYLEWAGKVTALGGSVSAEHGIGKIKAPLLRQMFGEDGIREMKKLKHLFDPEGRLNPGNLF